MNSGSSQYEPSVLCGIVTFNPKKNLIKRTVKSIVSQVTSVIIVDNSSDNINDWINEIKGIDNKIYVIQNTKNEGIAKALNQIFTIAVDSGFEWVLTLDHDSECPSKLIKELLMSIDLDTGIIAPQILYRNNEQYSIQMNGKAFADWVITSGSLTSIYAWEAVNGFDEVLFIDGVDRDFCIRIRNAGYRIVRDYDIVLLHELGNLKCINKFGKVIYVTYHSPMRKYYMARNVIYLDKKHGTHISAKYILKLLVKTVFFEKERVYEKCTSIWGGYSMA